MSATNTTSEKTKVHFFRDEFMEGRFRRPEPFLTVDYNSQTNRLVTAGIQTDIKVWEISYSTDDVMFKLVATMNPIYDSAKVVNIARWSPCGNFIATGCGRGAVIIWKKKGLIDQTCQQQKRSIALNIQDDETDLSFLDSEVKPTEEWIIVKKFGGEEGEDVWDLNWSSPLIDHKTGKTTYLLATTSMDRRLKVYQPLETYDILFEYISDVHSSIGGVAWDPLGYYLAIQLSTGKKSILFGLNQERFSILGPRSLQQQQHQQTVGGSSSSANESSKKKKKNAPLFEKIGTIKKSSKDNKELFQGDNHTIQYRSTVLNSVRRLSFSPDGTFLFTTAGLSNSLHMFYRNLWKKPVKCIAGLTSTCPIVRFSPILYKSISEKPSILPYRMMACASSKDEIIIFDTETNNVLYRAQRLFTQTITDVAWSNDGSVLFLSSQEGLMGIIRFDPTELGERYNLLSVITEMSTTTTTEPPATTTTTTTSSSNTISSSPLEIHISKIGQVISQSSQSLQKIIQSNAEAPKEEEQVNVLVPKRRTAALPQQVTSCSSTTTDTSLPSSVTPLIIE